MSAQINTKDLVIVGCGIKFMSHLTMEAKNIIKSFSKVLYLVNEPMMVQWINEKNSNSESLESIYFSYSKRREAYSAISDYIVNMLEKYDDVAVVLYGHPTVFAEPALTAVQVAEKMGVKVSIVPGVSAEDCLFADLRINPGSVGCQSFEATDFLVYERKFDSSSHLVLWQIGVMGSLGHEHGDHKKILNVLTRYLTRFYSESHQVIIYEAAQYPTFKPLIKSVSLMDFANAEVSSLSTLYVPPYSKATVNHKMLEELGLKVEHPLEL